MRLSLITPSAENGTQFLEELNQSIVQTKRLLEKNEIRTEWLVHGDGTTLPRLSEADGTTSSSVSQGVSAARNQLLRRVAGDWVYPLDADDLIDPRGMLELMQAAGQVGEGCGFLATNRETLTGKTLKDACAGKTRSYKKYQYGEEWCLKQAAPHANSVLYRPEVITEAGGWPELTQHEDVLLLAKVNQSHAGLWLPISVTRYRLWEGQTIQKPEYGKEKEKICLYLSQEINKAREAAGLEAVSPRISRGGTQWREENLLPIAEILGS